jgi:hypothetical protein
MHLDVLCCADYAGRAASCMFRMCCALLLLDQVCNMLSLTQQSSAGGQTRAARQQHG